MEDAGPCGSFAPAVSEGGATVEVRTAVEPCRTFAADCREPPGAGEGCGGMSMKSASAAAAAVEATARVLTQDQLFAPACSESETTFEAAAVVEATASAFKDE